MHHENLLFAGDDRVAVGRVLRHSAAPSIGQNRYPAFAAWRKIRFMETSFDKSRYYMISKSTPAGKSITILASDGEDEIDSPDDKTVMIPEIGRVRYRRCSVGGDEEFARFETDPFTRDDDHGGKVYYIVRVNTDDGDPITLLLKSSPASHDLEARTRMGDWT